MADLLRDLRKEVLTCLARSKTPRVDQFRNSVREALDLIDAKTCTNKRGLLDALCVTPKADIGKLCKQFNIERRTLYAWKTEIADVALIIAAEEGLFSMRRRMICERG